jgi:uncharacterized membrane protein
MNKLHENAHLSFERILFFSDAVFAIAITLLVLEIKVPDIAHSDPVVREALGHMWPKFAGFLYSFFIIGLSWIEHHRIFRYIGSWDFGLVWRNLLFLLFVAFIPFPTALFSEYYWSQTAFIMYVAAFGLAALAKIWIWQYAVKHREILLVAEVDDETVRQISLRSWAVPIVCALAIGMSFIAIAFGGFMFPLIPLVANLLYRRKKVTEAVV